MDLLDLVRAALGRDSLAARQWVQDASRARIDWSAMAQPAGVYPNEMVVAAALTEMLAQRAGVRAPTWVASVGASPEPIYLIDERMPRMRAHAEATAPMPLRRRNVFAPAEFLTAV